jgi:hypothetical protein
MNTNAATKGASAAVSGYMAFLLYALALLACRFFFVLASGFVSLMGICHLVIRFCGSTGYIIVRMFAGE